jgi:hypothetical protein
MISSICWQWYSLDCTSTLLMGFVDKLLRPYNPPEMPGFPDRSRVEMLSSAGMLRVTITPRSKLYLVLELALLAAFVAMGWKQWPALFREQPIIFIFVAIGIISGLWYQVAGSEEIEFSQQRLMIRKDRPLWPKNLEYPLRECSELQIREPGEGESDRFSCRVRGSTFTFGADLSEEQATQIMIELQRTLPDAADQLLASGSADPFGKHFTTLKLS